jgi:hypothetical protein
MTYFEKIVNVLTGEEILRPYTPEEITALQTNKTEIEAEQAAKDAEQASKNAARQAVLDKLGLSVDEITALLG